MNISKQLNTERLLLKPLQKEDADFVRELVNTDGWIRFIGNRNINSTEDAIAYIERILLNPVISYLVVKLKENNISAGIITFIQRDYLEHPDIGFAFLPLYSGKGYAFEAAKAVIGFVIDEGLHSTILATTLPDNKSSIQLLRKLGLQFHKEIEQENERLLVYAISLKEDQ